MYVFMIKYALRRDVLICIIFILLARGNRLATLGLLFEKELYHTRDSVFFSTLEAWPAKWCVAHKGKSCETFILYVLFERK